MILYIFLGILFVGQVVFCFISYNGAGWDFVLYIGWAVFTFSMVLGWFNECRISDLAERSHKIARKLIAEVR